MTFKQKDVFFSLLRFAVCGKTVNDDVKNLIDEECLVALYKLAKQHDLAHLIGYALAKNDLFGENSFLKQKFVQQMGTAVYRYEQLNYEYNKIIECLSEHGVKHVALKGSVIRKLYLEPWMRTSCDIDILVQESDLESTTNLLCEHLAYKRERLKTINEL